MHPQPGCGCLAAMVMSRTRAPWQLSGSIRSTGSKTRSAAEPILLSVSLR